MRLPRTRLPGLCTLLALGAPLQGKAGTVVLHDGGDSVRATGAVAERLRLPVGDLDAVSGEQIGQPALRVLGAEVLACSRGGRRLSDIADRVDLAARNLDFGEFEAARDSLDEAWAGVRCLEEPLDPLVAHRVHFLLGIVAIATEAPEEVARAHFAQARQFAPRVPWDDAFFPRGRELYETAVHGDDLATHTLSLLGLADPEGRAWIDGRPWTGPAVLGRGEHLAQVREDKVVHTAAIHLEADASVIDPETDPTSLVAGAIQATPQALGLLRVALPGERSLYAFDDSGVYRVELDAGAVERVPDLPSLPPRPWGPWAFTAGAGSLAGSAAVGVPAWSRANQSAGSAAAFLLSAKAAQGPVDDLRAAYDFEAARYEAGVRTAGIASAVAAVSVGVALAGIANWDATRRKRQKARAWGVQDRAGEGGSG